MDRVIVAWIFLLLINLNSSLTPPKTDGCTNEFSIEKCMYKFYCLNKVNATLNQLLYITKDRHRTYYNNPSGKYDCVPNLSIQVQDYYYEYNYYMLFVTLQSISHEVPKGDDAILPLIYSLDLSYNNYEVTPNFKAMNNLTYLNLSQNFLTIAKLYNNNELSKLKELDLSHNKINTIEVGRSNFRNLRVLNLSYNHLVTLPNAIFDDFSELETLDMSHNILIEIGIASFEGLKKVSSLTLSHNSIFELNGCLFRFSRLQTLNLSYNKLKEIKYHDFENLQELTYLNLYANSIVSIEKTVFYNMKSLQSLNLANNNLNDLSGISFANNNLIKNVDISNNNLKKLTRGIFSGLRVKYFNINGNNLEGSISNGSFTGLGEVITLDLSHQELTGIEDYAFKGLENIVEIYLNKNKLETVTNKSFKNLATLTMLDISDNKIMNLQFDTTDLTNLDTILLRNNLVKQIQHDFFKGLHSLHFLDLSNNKILKFDPKMFDSLHELINLDVSGNPLNGTLETGTFDGLASLPVLDISESQITTVQNGSFTEMVALEKLNISYSKVTELEYNCFTGIAHVKTIDLKFNQLTSIYLNWTHLQNLKVLLLSHNSIQVITGDTFYGLKSLSKLDLQQNKLEIIHDDSLENLQTLRYLDLSYNSDMVFNASLVRRVANIDEIILSGLSCELKFTAVNQTLLTRLDIANSSVTNVTTLDLKQLNSLRTLIMSYNNIRTIEAKAFLNLSNVQIIDLSFNKIIFIQPGSFRDNEFLRSLNISHNSLATISYGVFSGLVNLNTLDMSYNSLKTLNDERFYELPSLEVLILDYNKIDFINTEEFAGTKLRTLSIGGNFIPCQLLVNFKKNVRYEICAIKYESIKESVNGIACANEIPYRYKKQNESYILDSREILNDIRDTMHKIEDKNFTHDRLVDSYSYYFNNITQEVKGLTEDHEKKMSTLINHTSIIMKQTSDRADRLETINKSVNTTNQLLEKILKYLSQKPVSHNVSNLSDLITYINSVKNEIETTLLAERKKIDELEKKIGLTEFNAITSTSRAIQEKNVTEQLTDNRDNSGNRSTTFTNICVALILIVLVCFILYKIYKSGIFVRTNRTRSTRELANSIETQEL